jgi:hypothetical protein
MPVTPLEAGLRAGACSTLAHRPNTRLAAHSVAPKTLPAACAGEGLMKCAHDGGPTLQGTGRFVRLALEAPAAPSLDGARRSDQRLGVVRLMWFASGREQVELPCAPLLLKAGRRVAAERANVFPALGTCHGLAPATETGRLCTHSAQRTIADGPGRFTTRNIGSPRASMPRRRSASRDGALPIFCAHDCRTISASSSACWHTIGAGAAGSSARH